MEVKLCADVYYIISMMTTTTNSLSDFSLKLLPHSSNFTAARMEVKLVRMCITSFPRKPQQQKASGTLTSSLLKLANGTTHEDETWYACA